MEKYLGKYIIYIQSSYGLHKVAEIRQTISL